MTVTEQTYGQGMEMEGLAVIEADVPTADCAAAREMLGLIGPEHPWRKLRDRKGAAGGVRAAEPACAVAQHAGTVPGPTNQGVNIGTKFLPLHQRPRTFGPGTVDVGGWRTTRRLSARCRGTT